MGGLNPSREVVLRSTVDGLPLILFRPGAPESCAMTVELGPDARVGGRVLLSGEAVEELYALAGLILAGRPGAVDAAIICGVNWYDHAAGKQVSCGLEAGHPYISNSPHRISHVTSRGEAYVEPPF